MTRKEKIRLYIAHWLEKKFPNYFCWASLVTWAYSGSQGFFGFLKCNDNGGCKKDGEKTACYCGKYGNAEYFKQ